MYKIKLFGNVIAGIICLSIAHTASAHFQMIIPSDDMVEQNEARKLDLDVKFWHPYEGHGMHMQKPVQFGVMLKGEKTNIQGHEWRYAGWLQGQLPNKEAR